MGVPVRVASASMPPEGVTFTAKALFAGTPSVPASSVSLKLSTSEAPISTWELRVGAVLSRM